ncbi:MAG: HDOD domain-containing protein [Bryobacteraceae bacterium]
MTSAEEALKKLPPFKPVTVKLLKLTGTGEIEPRKIAELIEVDPALTAEVLAVANSPLFSRGAEIRDVTHALVFLGFDRVKAIISIVAMRALARRGRKTIALRSCWLHSVATALIAARMAPAYGHHPDQAYTAGLLHDIGRFGLFGAFPEKYPAALLERYETKREILEGEELVVGLNHCQAGLILAREWRLPQDYTSVVAHHLDPTEIGSSQEVGMTSLIHLACLVSDALRFEAVRYWRVLHLGELRTSLPEQLRARFPVRTEDLEEYVIDHISALDE